jgi:hypothetical protein
VLWKLATGLLGSKSKFEFVKTYLPSKLILESLVKMLIALENDALYLPPFTSSSTDKEIFNPQAIESFQNFSI